MKKAASVFLRAEITPMDVERMIHWMENPEVTRYLNEDAQVAASLRQLVRTVPGPMLTCRFNQGGRFFLVCHEQEGAIGYVRLRHLSPEGMETVYVIGEDALWGQGYGKSALRLALAHGFLQERASHMVAKVHAENVRSLRAVRSCGFRETGTYGELTHYRITVEEYLKGLR